MPRRYIREPAIELRCSKIHGLGVFAVQPFRHHQSFGLALELGYQKRLVPWSHVDGCSTILREKIYSFCFGTPDGFVPPPYSDFERLTVACYMNHSCDGNVGFSRTGKFIAIRPITAGEELVYDYALAEGNPDFQIIECRCGSSVCRGVVTGHDWRQLSPRMTQYILPTIRQLVSAM